MPEANMAAVGAKASPVGSLDGADEPRGGVAYERELQALHAREVAEGDRFEFGQNWSVFLQTIDDERIGAAEQSLRTMLGVTTLEGQRFIDIGSGSGLFSLAARNLGAEVVSFDYDPKSVACTRELRRRYWPDDAQWRVEAGSVLDPDYLRGLGSFHVVYSWGVLHHTGQMWPAIRNALRLVRPGGRFFIAIYNDQGAWSKRWLRIKQVYCGSALGRVVVSCGYIPWRSFRMALSDVVRGRSPLHTYRSYKRNRGMAPLRDWIDWLGGLPFEVAKPEDIIFPIQREGFALTNLVTQRGTVGCVEYVFRRSEAEPA